MNLLITDKYYYDEGWHDRETGSFIEVDTAEEDLKTMLNTYYENMKTELDISNSVVHNNLLSLENK